jgi:hypothetical protein
MPQPRPVVCTYCNETIYGYTGPGDRVVFKAEYFEPRGGYSRPASSSGLACPNCGERWTAVSLQGETIRMAVSPATRGSGVVKY